MEFKHEGNALFVEERYAESITCYTKALLQDPTDADALSKRAAANLKLHRLQDALSDATQAVALDGSVAMAQLRKGSGWQ